MMPLRTLKHIVGEIVEALLAFKPTFQIEDTHTHGMHVLLGAIEVCMFIEHGTGN